MGEITYLNKAINQKRIPKNNCTQKHSQQFGLTEYDKLEWILKAEGSELVIVVKPKKGEVR